MAKILVIDDDRNIRFAFKKTLKHDKYGVLTAASVSDARKILNSQIIDVLFLDITMPGENGLEFLRELRDGDFDLPVIMMTGYGTMHTAIESTQLNAFEYITKPLDINQIRQITKRAIDFRQQQQESPEELDSQIRPSDPYEIIGSSQAIQTVFKQIGLVTLTPNTTPILIRGENGTGKELVALAVHSKGRNPGSPFSAIDCTTLPENLLESEIFGHEKGAFTGAYETKKGRFEAAENGTIFLDEIGNMSPQLQQKLLRVLQERNFHRIGSNDALPVKARFIAATNCNLEQMVKDKKFRQDLYYRLNVIMIQLPPLTERREDIAILAMYFLKNFSEEIGKNIIGFNDEAIAALRKYNYPGNVRQLKNIVERAAVNSTNRIIGRESLDIPEIDGDESHITEGAVLPVLNEARRENSEKFEKEYLVRMLNRTDGRVLLAAEKAGITRQAFQRLMKKHGFRSRQFRHSQPD